MKLKKEITGAYSLIVITLLLSIGKLLNWWNCSWWTATAPIWIPFLLVAVILIALFIITMIGMQLIKQPKQ